MVVAGTNRYFTVRIQHFFYYTNGPTRIKSGMEMLQTVDKLERLLQIASEEGISVRCEWLGGIRGGLVRVGRTPILFIDESLTALEQFEHVRIALSQLDWTETEWWDEVSHLLELAGEC
jgi:hypothetical protein